MATAYDSQALIEHPDRLFINGEWVKPSSDAMLDVIMPSTEEVFLRFAEAQTADIDHAVEAARTAFDRGPWPRLSHAERATYLHAFADRIDARKAEIGRIWTSEMGAVVGISDHLAKRVADAYRHYAALADTFAFVERHPSSAGNVGLLVREPVGVVAAVLPWNSPLVVIAHKTAPALLAGCTVVIKSPPEAPGLGHLIGEIAREIGLPPGVVNVVNAERVVSEHLVRHPGIDKVTFTGSNAVGKRIGIICAERVARCTLELGGKSAAVVLDDYDVAGVAKSVSGTTRLLTGQACAALTRIIVPRHRHGAMVDALSAEFAAIKVGDPFDTGSEMGPLAMRRQRDRVESYIEAGRREGAVVATGGGRPAHLNRGFYVEPTVFGNVTNDMTIAREEIFGPVVAVIPADDEKQAVEIANDSVFGLAASVFTNDPQRAYEVSRALRAGTVGQNGLKIDFSIAFGGFKQSGIGREGGVEGLLSFLETKTIIMDEAPGAI